MRIITNRKIRKTLRKLHLLPPRRLSRRQRARRLALVCSVLAAVALATAGTLHQGTRTVIPQTAYAPLLETIAKGESRDNYDAHYGNAGNSAIRFTDMTVAEVLEWQAAFVRQGSPSSAVGRYQFIRPTLAGLVKQLRIDPQARFDAALQDRLAIALLERRGSRAFVGKALTREQFAAELAKEWAALPRVIGDDPHESYYDGDGLNKSRISIDEVYRALEGLEAV